jgi:hypothetical protein
VPRYPRTRVRYSAKVSTRQAPWKFRVMVRWVRHLTYSIACDCQAGASLPLSSSEESALIVT